METTFFFTFAYLRLYKTIKVPHDVDIEYIICFDVAILYFVGYVVACTGVSHKLVRSHWIHTASGI